MEKNSKLYAYAASLNIGVFISEFEQKEKNIQLIRNTESEYNFDKIVSDLASGTHVYFIGNDTAISQIFVTEKVGKSFYWQRYNENLQLYEITKATPKVKIESNFKNQIFKFGKEVILEYLVTNGSNSDLKINSIELELPKGLKFSGMLNESQIKNDPGLSMGKYMWVSDDYIIPLNDKMIFSFRVIPAKPGYFNIKLRLTAGGVYFDAKEMSFKIN